MIRLYKPSYIGPKSTKDVAKGGCEWIKKRWHEFWCSFSIKEEKKRFSPTCFRVWQKTRALIGLKHGKRPRDQSPIQRSKKSQRTVCAFWASLPPRPYQMTEQNHIPVRLDPPIMRASKVGNREGWRGGKRAKRPCVCDLCLCQPIFLPHLKVIRSPSARTKAGNNV